MNKEFLTKLVDNELSIRQMIPYLNTSYSNIRHWLKKYNLKTKKSEKKLENGKRTCLVCKIEKNLECFYNSNKSYQSYCKKCSNLYHQNRVREVKFKMIEYKGGKCIKCELRVEDSHYAVFEFHHIDPLQKDQNFRRIKSQKWETIRKELDKCVLLCANCHRVEHADINGWGFR
jgi:hypothetical protein